MTCGPFSFSSEADRFWLANEAKRIAQAEGFSREEQAQLATSISELVSNAVKHGGGGGTFTLTVHQGPPTSIQVVIEDDGPGIPEVEDALRDGFSEGRWLTPDVPMSKRRGLGTGLGAVQRMMTQLTISRRASGGTRVDTTLVRKMKDRAR
ncbi:Anti-sigma B factor RsbT [Labilithrix luteola]|uniref:histidine kinase n=1 Tax=Labilithrix luteola TaxID=1391654 RepID=A0A0K1Q101_9BACT|nr:ATP-binding protein [Labilithrix luteola]AKU99301.1 Anti-sigma B factor RsbT [Labilithrix luteola]